MKMTDYFTIDGIITVEFEDDPASAIRCVVKKIKKDLVAIKFPIPDVSREDLPNNLFLSLDVDSINGGNVIIKGRVLSNKTFPIVIVKPTELVADNTLKTHDTQMEGHLDRYVQSYAEVSHGDYERDTARIEDNFSVTYKHIDPDTANVIKEDFLLKPTHLREREDVSAGINLMSLSNPVNFVSMSQHIDPILVETIKDIYSRIDAIANIANLYVRGTEEKDKDSLAALCTEISGTGLRLTSWKEIDVGDILRIIVSPPKADIAFSVSLLGEAVWVKELPGSGGAPSKHLVGIRYYAVNEKDRDDITRYTFQVQQEFLRLRKEREAAEAY